MRAGDVWKYLENYSGWKVTGGRKKVVSRSRSSECGRKPESDWGTRPSVRSSVRTDTLNPNQTFHPSCSSSSLSSTTIHRNVRVNSCSVPSTSAATATATLNGTALIYRVRPGLDQNENENGNRKKLKTSSVPGEFSRLAYLVFHFPSWTVISFHLCRPPPYLYSSRARCSRPFSSSSHTWPKNPCSPNILASWDRHVSQFSFICNF